MDKDLLQLAQHALRITDVALRRARSEVVDGYYQTREQPRMTVQLMQRTLRSEILEPDDKKQAPSRHFRVHVQFGIRWVRASAKKHSHKSGKKIAAEEKNEPDVLAFVEAIFVAEYELSKEVDQAGLDEFALHNAPFNVWPFWREYVFSQAQRMNLPKFVMPLQALPSQAAGTADAIKEG